ncbi:MAG: division/cell wall cluster transcriptional repressor MraZ [Sumerlaeia bacterium]
MTQLSGMIECSVDERHRVAIPAKMLKCMKAIAGVDESDKSVPMTVVVGLSLGRNLGVFPKNVHDDLVAFLNGKPKHDTDWNRIRTWIIGTAEEQTLDKQNRIRIPALLAKKLKLQGEVVVTGVEDHIELIGKDDWEREFDEYMDEFESVFQRASGTRP